ncbi:hypothetical protein E2C01_009576 [Portunus trituberculatus]|uniref:Uncharacterized protein n=1 Tax=Portunus trituberculatus TaxID=210409 RepID=A0A5B7D641_PORTR|nr:hypothetical protein [Portunus trituberculatus]
MIRAHCRSRSLISPPVSPESLPLIPTCEGRSWVGGVGMDVAGYGLGLGGILAMPPITTNTTTSTYAATTTTTTTTTITTAMKSIV